MNDTEYGRPVADRILLVLDLDETLIHACQTPLNRPPNFSAFGYHVYVRPGLDAFLATVTRNFDLAVWSSASDDYVDAVVDAIFPDRSLLRFVWGRSRATLRRATPYDLDCADPWDHMEYLKPLKKVRRRGWPLQRILIVDDTPAKCVRNYGNAVHPREYFGEDDDVELALLERYLVSISTESDVRRIEKRHWRELARALGDS